MNKKFKSLFVLSVLLVLIVGTAALSANETSADTTNTDDSLIDATVDTTDSDVTDESQSSEDANTNETDTNEETDSNEETNSNLTPTDTNTSSNQKLIEGLSNDEVLEEMAYELSLGTDSENNELANILNSIDSQKYAKLVSMLYNHQLYSDYDFFEALSELDFASQKEILDIMIEMDANNIEYYQVPYKTNNYKIKTITNNVKTSPSNNNQSSPVDTTNTPVINTLKPSNYVKTPIIKYAVDDSYEIYLYYLALYTEGRITFDEFINILNYYGFDTSEIILNEDGSVTYNGMTSDIPVSSDDNTENDTSTDVNNTDDANTDDANTDSTNTDDTGSDSTNTDDAGTDSTDTDDTHVESPETTDQAGRIFGGR